jgi:hypothetical protein
MPGNLIETAVIKSLLGYKSPGEHVSRNNRLVNCRIYGFNDGHRVSPDNKLVHADVENLNSSVPAGDGESRRT